MSQVPKFPNCPYSHLVAVGHYHCFAALCGLRVFVLSHSWVFEPSQFCQGAVIQFQRNPPSAGAIRLTRISSSRLLARTYLLGVGLIDSRVPLRGLLGGSRDLPGRLAECLGGGRHGCCCWKGMTRCVVVDSREVVGLPGEMGNSCEGPRVGSWSCAFSEGKPSALVQVR